MTGAIHRTPATALQLFQIGHDTESISSILNIPEPEALKRLSVERSAMLGLPNPYSDLQPGRAFDRFHSLVASQGAG
jgi:hypothetical protein